MVATSRDAAVTCRETLDRLNGPESAVVMSADHNDEERLAKWHLPRNEQERVIDRFKDRNDPLSILIVCDMLLTGFDAPVEQVMYLDQPLKEHGLLQAIARVNRPLGDEKTYGLVVDYWGVSARLQDALAIFSTTDVQGALTPNVDELPRLQTRHAAAMKFFRSVADTNDLDACVRVLEPEDVRAAFDLAFRRSSQSMDMLLPDQRALRHHADLRWLGEIRGTARARYRDDRFDLSGCGEKVRKLVARPAASTARVRQRRERPLPRAALPPEGASERDRRGEAARRLAARTGAARTGTSSCPGSAVMPPSGCRNGWRRGGRGPASRCPASSLPTSRSGGGAATTAAPSG